MNEGAAHRLEALDGFYIPAGTEVLLGGKPYTTRRHVLFTLGHIIDEQGDALTILLHARGRQWRMVAPRRAVRPQPAPPQPGELPSHDSAQEEQDALDALRAMAPAVRLEGAANLISVPSDRDPQRTYTVTLSPQSKAVDCSCHDFAFRQRRCKHMVRAELFERWEEAIEAMLARGVPARGVLEGWRLRTAQLGVEGAMLRVIAAGRVAGLRLASEPGQERP